MDETTKNDTASLDMDIPGATTPEERKIQSRLEELGWASSSSLKQALQQVPEDARLFIDVGGDGMRAEKMLEDPKEWFCITITFKPSHTFTNIKYSQPPQCLQPSRHLFVFADAFSEFASISNSSLKKVQIEMTMLHGEVINLPTNQLQVIAPEIEVDSKTELRDETIDEYVLIKLASQALGIGNQIEVVETRERIIKLKDLFNQMISQLGISTTVLTKPPEEIIDEQCRTSYRHLAIDPTTSKVFILQISKI